MKRITYKIISKLILKLKLYLKPYLKPIVVKLRKYLKLVRNKFCSKPEVFPSEYIAYNGDSKIRIVIILQNHNLWPSLKTVYESFIDRGDVDIKVILTTILHTPLSFKMLSENKEFLLENEIPFVPYQSFSVERFKPHVVFLQTPNLRILPENLNANILTKVGCRLAYIPYGLEIGGGVTNYDWQFNTDLFHKAWKIFCRSKNASLG